eukprot:1392850-Amphidinium_carterae.1
MGIPGVFRFQLYFGWQASSFHGHQSCALCVSHGALAPQSGQGQDRPLTDPPLPTDQDRSIIVAYNP